MCPDFRKMCPDFRKISPDFRKTSPDFKRNSPEFRKTTPAFLDKGVLAYMFYTNSKALPRPDLGRGAGFARNSLGNHE